jgi:hypothetical protein
MVIHRVVERAADRLAALVYLDAFYRNDGNSGEEEPTATLGIVTRHPPQLTGPSRQPTADPLAILPA